MSPYHAILEKHCIGHQDMRRNLIDLGPSKWAAALHPGLRSLIPFLRRLSQAVLPEYGRVESELDPYHLQETMKRIFLDEIWRLKEAETPIELDTSQQRTPKPPPKFQDGLAASAPAVHAIRVAEETAAARNGHDTQANTASGSTLALPHSKQKRKAAKDSDAAPTRRSKRQRNKRAALGPGA
ncbi:hypothetical protein AURDEDRAFT_144346 [Auricularia subglabra TFB-10046 SS5]|nr:hypothetical protein AURDEDRAFT_144346 [Auricularia subglabra TFB-10046 SS5]